MANDKRRDRRRGKSTCVKDELNMDGWMVIQCPGDSDFWYKLVESLEGFEFRNETL